ncbi:MAG: hypothetical protein FWE85_00640 [Clostridiales bacterium]|nr:hypothetical protein [Clostridiales bacterium]
MDSLLNASKKQIQGFIDNPESLTTFVEAGEYEAFIAKLESMKLAGDFWSEVLFHIHVDEKLIELLIKKDYAREALGHLDIADKWLLLLSEDVVEALQTLIVRYYTHGTASYKSKNASL